ncbi:ABC transporter permease [Rhodobacteraceae bacterium WD3A24]|nr:ABC transporter permease [Rhodobacteraceae bacterium WD3A24]
MRALDAKLLRDLRRIWAQSLAIALVLACGVAVLVLAHGTQTTLSQTRDAYYERNRFADVFASATRAPEQLTEEIARIDGVAQVQTRISKQVILDMEGMVEPAMARLVSLPVAGAPVLNVPLVRAGRLPDPLRPDEVALSAPFARANDLRAGDSFRAILGGRMRELTVTGLLLSPEFIYTISPGTMIPDDRRFGIIWMGRAAAAAAFDLEGAFNDVALRLTRGASVDAVIAALDDLLAPYGGTGAQGRDGQMSHAFLQGEMDQLAAIAVVLPPIFLIVSAFLVNMVLGRLIAQERAQIGLMKAVGYRTGEIGWHYLKMSAGIGVGGVLLGWGVGFWLSGLMTGLYAQYFSFPYLVPVPSTWAFAVSAAMGLAAVLVGALRAVARMVRLSPAEAMQPPAPPHFRRGWADRLGETLRLRQTSMMILRSILRWPGRAAVTLLGVAASVSVLVASFFSFDAMDVVIDEAFFQTNRQDVTLVLASARGTDVLQDALALPGVMQVEAGFSTPVRLSAGPREDLVSLEAHGPGDQLVRVLDQSGRAVAMPPQGLLLPDTLAAELGVRPGELLQVEFLAPPRETHMIPVSAVTRQSLGQAAHMSRAALFELMRVAPQVNRINVTFDGHALADLYARVKETPAISGVLLWSDLRRQLTAQIEQNLLTMVFAYSVLGILITVGVVYNAARIQLSERAHELASLRVLGFSRAEVGFVLVGEIMVLTLAAVPVGWVLGYAFAALTAGGLSTELVSIPLVVSVRTYATAALIVVVSALVSALMVRRRLDRIDIVSALKQKE